MIGLGSFASSLGRGRASAPPAPVSDNEIWIFLEAGQSNSEGLMSELSEVTTQTYLQSPLTDVFTWNGKLSTVGDAFEQLVPGSNSGIQYPNPPSAKQIVGAECEFGYRLQQSLNKTIRIIKHSQGERQLKSTGDAVRDWNPNSIGELYDEFINKCLAAKSKLESDNPGKTVVFKSLHWNQGENDRNYAAGEYYNNLTLLVDSLRTDLSSPNLYIECVLPKLCTNNVWNDIIQKCNEDANMNYFDARNLATHDGTHYTLPAMLEIGNAHYENLINNVL